MTTLINVLDSYDGWTDDEQKRAFFADAQEAGVQPSMITQLFRVLNKPSQFVGRVESFATAVEHMQKLAQWELDNAGNDTLGEYPELSEDVDTRDTKEIREEKRQANAINDAKRQVAADEWHDAVAQRKRALEYWDGWRNDEMKRIQDAHRNKKDEWDSFVEGKRAAFRAVK